MSIRDLPSAAAIPSCAPSLRVLVRATGRLRGQESLGRSPTMVLGRAHWHAVE